MDTVIRREPADDDNSTIEQNTDALIEFSYRGSIYAVSACIERGDDIDKVWKPLNGSQVRNMFGQFTPHENNNTDSNNLEPFWLKSGDTALIAAVKRDHVDITRLLLENGANIAIESNYISTVPCGMRLSGLTPLMCAVARCDLSVEILDMLLAHNANINYQNEKGLSALMYSCQLGKAAGTKYLVAHGADMELKDKREFNALMCACVTNQMEIIDILLENGAILSPQCFLLTVQYGHFNLVQKFVKILGKKCVNYQVDSLGINNCEIGTNHHLPAALGDTALIIATRRDHKEIVKLLVDLGADTTVCNSLGVNALNLAVECSMMDIFLATGAAPSASSSGITIKLSGELLIDAVRCRNLNVIRYYHSHGGDVNYEPPPIIKTFRVFYTYRTAEIRQDSALAMACRHSYINVVNLLIHFNAKITPEVWQRAVNFGHEAIVKRLIIAGVDFNQQYDFGKTALIEATYAGRMKVVEVLLAAGAKLELKNMFDMTALHMSFRYNDANLTKLLLNSGADVHAVNSRGETPLMEALFNNNLAVVHALLDRGSDVNRQNFLGNTALMFAIVQECNLNIISTLLTHGADVNLVNDFGETALIMAAKLNNIQLVNMLVRTAGLTCINAQNEWGKTACTYASRRKNFQMVKLLLLNNADASIGIRDSTNLFKGLCDKTRPAAFELHKKESNWRNRRSFITFLSENSYIQSKCNSSSDQPYIAMKYEKILSNYNLLRRITSYL